MKDKVLANLITQRPFRPFTVRLTNGARVRISDPDRVALHPDGGGLFSFEKDGGFRILNIPLIAELQQKCRSLTPLT